MIWIIFFELIVLFALFFWLPVMRYESFFAVHVSREFFVGQGKKILEQYRITLGILFALHLTASVLFIGTLPRTLFQMSPILSLLLMNSLLHYFFYFRVMPHKISLENAKTVASLKRRKLLDYTNIVIEATVILMILMTGFALVHFYPQLPDSIPSHWNFAGKPDQWVERSWTKILVFPALALWLQGLLLITKNSFLQTKVSLPSNKTAAYFALKEKSLRFSLTFIDALRLLVGVVITIVSLNVIISAIPAYTFLEPVSAITLWSCGGAVMILSIFSIFRIMQINTQLDDLVGDDMNFNAFSDNGWLGGGTIYYNPNDPSLFVEKKIGVGNTINFANKQAKYFLLYFVGGGGILFFLAISNF
jgi:uncharacterized membrane protein